MSARPRYDSCKNVILVIFLLSAGYTGCEKFTGYDYDAADVGVSSIIHGQVQNIFDLTPVRHAQLFIGSAETLTDTSGRFSLPYLLGVDDTRNKPVDVLFRSPDYYPLDTSLVIYPPQTEFNLKAIYAAPIIKQAYIGIIPVVAQGSGEIYLYPVSQILLFDYQGLSTIDSVSTTFFYVKTGDPVLIELTIGMRLMDFLSQDSAYFQAVGPARIEEEYLYYDRNLVFFVKDNEGFTETITLNDVQVFLSEPLFPIIADP